MQAVVNKAAGLRPAAGSNPYRLLSVIAAYTMVRSSRRSG